MTILLTYTSGEQVRLQHVRCFALTGRFQVEVQTFGNNPVTHRQVAAVAMEPFDMTFVVEG